MIPCVWGLMIGLAVPTIDSGGPVYRGLDRQLAVDIPRLDGDVPMDGTLSAPQWRRAAVLAGFSEYQPVDGRAAEDSTQVLVWYARDAIYFGIRAFESHGAVVRATLAARDAIDADDRVEILLDPYDDHRQALVFAVNPLGVQEDGVWTEGGTSSAGGQSTSAQFGGNMNLSPDYVYASRGHVTPWGYEVEVRVPFKSLRFQDRDPQNWGLQILRIVQHTGEEDSWTPAVRASASFLIQSGTLLHLTRLHRGLVMDLTPEYTTKVDGAPHPRAQTYGYDGQAAAGATVQWGITPGLTADVTAHPDFSEVEADSGQITVNQRFALFYPEKRPFFLDGLEEYNTPNTLIYTRQIVQPDAGAKLAGKIGGTTIAYLGAVDTPDSTGAHPISNVLRLKQDLGATSALGLVYTDREESGQYNRVLGPDAYIARGGLSFSQVQLVDSWTRDAHGFHTGPLWDIVFADRTGRSYGTHYEIKGISPDFQAADGFVNRTGIVSGMLEERFSWYGSHAALIQQLNSVLYALPTWQYNHFAPLGAPIEGGLEEAVSATLHGGWVVTAAVTDSMQRFDPASYTGYRVVQGTDTTPFVLPHGLYNRWAGTVGVTTPYSVLSGGATAGYGATSIFAEAAPGRQLSVQTYAIWHPTRSLRINGSWTHQTIDRQRDGSRFATEDIPRVTVEYQLARALFVRYVGQYILQSQTPLEDPRTGQPLAVALAAASQLGALGTPVANSLYSDVLLDFQPTPGTVFFLGYGSTLGDPDTYRPEVLSRVADELFFKLSYRFRL